MPPRRKRISTANGSTPDQTALQLGPPRDEHLDISTLETWLWDAACAIRGATDAPKFKDFILPLVFFKRLSDVFDDEFAAHIETFGDATVARELVAADHADALATGRRPIVSLGPILYQSDAAKGYHHLVAIGYQRPCSNRVPLIP